MNVFKINENIACNVFSFIGYIYTLLLAINYQTEYASINPLAIFIDIFTFLTVIIILLIIYFREIKIHNKHPKISEEYKNNKKALLYYYAGIILHILTILIVIFIFPINTHFIFSYILFPSLYPNRLGIFFVLFISLFYFFYKKNFKINENIACNMFSFIGYIYSVLAIENLQTEYTESKPYISLINMLVFSIVIIILLIIYFREIKIHNKYPKIKKEYTFDFKALFLFYTGIILHILIIFMVFLIYPNATHKIFNHILYFCS